MGTEPKHSPGMAPGGCYHYEINRKKTISPSAFAAIENWSCGDKRVLSATTAVFSARLQELAMNPTQGGTMKWLFV